MEHKERKPLLFRGELALAIAVVINSLSVVLMLYSGAGISAISGVPYAFSQVFSFFSLGTWTYIFQAALILSLMVLRRRIVVNYLFSFAVGFVFSQFLDLHVDKPAPRRLGLAHRLLRDKLSADLRRHSSVKPLQTPYHSYRSFPQGAGQDKQYKLPQNKDIL